MLKKLFTYSFSFLLAAYFTIAGLGYNVIHYCCSECAEAGIEKVASLSCEGIHHQHNDADTKCSCGCSAESSNSPSHEGIALNQPADDACGLMRVNLDTPNMIEFEESAVLPFAFILSDLFDVFDFETIISLEKDNFAPPNLIIPYSGRDILTKHAVLRI